MTNDSGVLTIFEDERGTDLADLLKQWQCLTAAPLEYRSALNVTYKHGTQHTTVQSLIHGTKSANKTIQSFPKVCPKQ